MEAAILYSAGNKPGENLRYPVEDSELKRRIIHVRNQIVAIEQSIIHGDNYQVEKLFDVLFRSVGPSQKVPGFYLRKIERLRTILSQCTDLEKTWFYRYIRFISGELSLQKLGVEKNESPNGLASLWNSSFDERSASLDVLFNLSILEIDDSGNERTLFLHGMKTIMASSIFVREISASSIPVAMQTIRC